jgi:hypothetical protein
MVIVVTSTLAGTAQQAPDPAATLLHARERLLADLARMPRYTCVQTTTRKYYSASSHFRQPSCAALIREHEARNHELSTLGWDRLRLDVALVEGQNAYSWVGAPRFADDTIDKLAGRGPLASGDFGPLLRETLLRATVTFQGEEVLDGRRLLKYSYDMAIGKSDYKVKTHDGWARTAFSGTLLLDPETTDIARMIVRTAELPTNSAVCQAITEITYGRTSIHERMILIPRETRLRTIDRAGSESLSSTTFASCREYASTVRLLLNEAGAEAIAQGPAEPAATPHRAAHAPSPLPAGLQFKARIITPVDSDTAAAGDPIEAVLRSPIRDKNHAVVAPVGTRLHGRLRRVEQWTDPGNYFRLGIQLESAEIAGSNVPLVAVRYPPAGFPLRRTPPDDAALGIGTFTFRDEHLRLKQLDSEWITITADTGKDKK